MSFKIHYLVPAADGPVQSKPGGTTFKVGKDQKYVVACDPTILLTDVHRGTHEPWNVCCALCEATEVYKKTFYPRPGQGKAIEHADRNLPNPGDQTAAVPLVIEASPAK